MARYLLYITYIKLSLPLYLYVSERLSSRPAILRVAYSASEVYFSDFYTKFYFDGGDFRPSQVASLP